MPVLQKEASQDGGLLVAWMVTQAIALLGRARARSVNRRLAKAADAQTWMPWEERPDPRLMPIPEVSRRLVDYGSQRL